MTQIQGYQCYFSKIIYVLYVTFRQSFSFNSQEVLEKLTADDKELKDVNLNNISNIEEKQMCDIFDSLRKNQSLTRLSVVNCDVSKVDIRFNNGQLSAKIM